MLELILLWAAALTALPLSIWWFSRLKCSAGERFFAWTIAGAGGTLAAALLSPAPIQAVPIGFLVSAVSLLLTAYKFSYARLAKEAFGQSGRTSKPTETPPNATRDSARDDENDERPPNGQTSI